MFANNTFGNIDAWYLLTFPQCYQHQAELRDTAEIIARALCDGSKKKKKLSRFDWCVHDTAALLKLSRLELATLAKANPT